MADILDEYCQKYRNWGKWGPDDQKGTANYITPDKVLEALKIPRKGQIISMTLPYDANGPQTGAFRRINPVLQFLATGTDVAAGAQVFPRGLGYADDTITMPLQSGTQWDSLAHIFHNGVMYNGYPASDVSGTGAKRNSIFNHRETMVGRGVLLDVARYKGVDWLEDGYPITIEDLDGTAASEGVEVREGDIVCVRTGQMGRCLQQGWGTYAAGDAPGLSFYTAPWLYEKRIAAVAVDTWGFEVRPNELPDSFQPLHLVAIVNMGLMVGEIFNFEDIAKACAEDGVYEFLFAGPPLPFTGAVGSPLNALAIR
jgi:kynurenine formamidase